MSDTHFDQTLITGEGDLLTASKTWITLGAVALLGIGALVAYSWQQDKAMRAVEQSNAALVAAKTPEEKLVVARGFAGNVAASSWLLELGSTFYTDKKYTLSAEAYSLLVQRQPNSPMVPAALVGQAEALLANKQGEQAVPLLQKVIDSKTVNAYQPLARLVLADWQISQRKVQEARQTLQDLLARSPESSFAGESTRILTSLPK